jgi:hypothetical protein
MDRFETLKFMFRVATEQQKNVLDGINYTDLREAMAVTDRPELTKQDGHVYELWSDGEITLQKSGSLYGQRTLHRMIGPILREQLSTKAEYEAKSSEEMLKFWHNGVRKPWSIAFDKPEQEMIKLIRKVMILLQAESDLRMNDIQAGPNSF